MTQTVITEILKYIIPAILSFIIGLLSTTLKRLKASQVETESTKAALMESLKWLLRRCLIEDCEEYLEQGFITPDELAELDHMWSLYHNTLKGNGKGEIIYNKVLELPVKIKGEQEK